jgi:hypothetical protein
MKMTNEALDWRKVENELVEYLKGLGFIFYDNSGDKVIEFVDYDSEENQARVLQELGGLNVTELARILAYRLVE